MSNNLFSETQLHAPLEIVCAEPNDKIALIDADTIVYATCSVCEMGDDEAGYSIDMEYAVKEALIRIEELRERTGCKDVELHFTAGKNFRYTITDTYKLNRKDTRYPVGLQELKEALHDHHTCTIHTEIEADDWVVFAKKHNPDLYILCAVDKDVLGSVAGKHFNYYQSMKYNIPMKWMDIIEEEVKVFPYIQCLMGDSTDGIAGCPGIGPGKALDKLLPHLTPTLKELKKEYKATMGKASDKPLEQIVWPEKLLRGYEVDEKHLWNLVVELYEEKGLTERDAIKTMRLVNMHQLNEEGVLDLWIP